MVTRQKDVLMILAETIPDTLSLGKEIRMLIQLSFFIFLAQLDKMSKNKRRQRWITACHRRDSFVSYTKDSYICSIHFVRGNGPTKEYPDPISAVASKEKVSLPVFPFITLFGL